MISDSAQDAKQKDAIENGGLLCYEWFNELMVHQLHAETLKHIHSYVWNWLFPFFPLQMYFPIP